MKMIQRLQLIPKARSGIILPKGAKILGVEAEVVRNQIITSGHPSIKGLTAHMIVEIPLPVVQDPSNVLYLSAMREGQQYEGECLAFTRCEMGFMYLIQHDGPPV